MAMYQWSTTPANNASAGAIDWAEGQPPSTVNDSARQMMADVATWYAGPEWLNYGLTPTYVSATQFTVTGNQTAIYTVGRRVKATVSAGTVYGTIAASVFTALTTVTVILDSGNLDNGISEADVGILNPVNSSVGSPLLSNPTPEWLDFDLIPTYVSATQFTVAGNQTAIYTAGRRVRAFVTAGKIYGTISASAYTSLTTVTVTWDAGNLDSSVSEVDVGILNSSSQSVPALLSPSFVGTTKMSNTGAGASVIQLTGNGATTPNKFLGVLNGALSVFSSSGFTSLLSLDDVGNLTVAGTVTQHSDERLKTDWKPVSDDFLEKLSTIKSGTYRRTDIGEIQAGVSAQDLQRVLPQAVGGGAILSVAYGQAALVACVELAKEVVRLRALIEPNK